MGNSKTKPSLIIALYIHQVILKNS